MMNETYKLGSIHPPAVRASRWVLLLAAVAVALGCLITSLCLPVGGRAYTRAAAAGSTAAAAAYTVREYQGKIAVFAQGGGTPQQVLDVYVASLPAAEQQRLRKGIAVKTHAELLALLENYTS